MKRVLLCAALLASSGLASAAVVYKWMDAQGKIQYGDRPPDGVHAEVVELLGTHTGRSARPPDAPAPASDKTAAAPPAELSPKDAKKAVDSDVAQARDKQCADAQDRYKKLIEGRRLFKTGADGERQYLTSEEIDEERVNAKRDIDSICNSPT
jgi:hypothetical protein